MTQLTGPNAGAGASALTGVGQAPLQQPESSLEEWKKNVDLYIHHDNLKQSRVRHWLNTQAIFFGAVGFLVVNALGNDVKDVKPVERYFMLALAFLICVIGLVISTLFKRADARARLFTLFHRYNLCRIEARLRGGKPVENGTFLLLGGLIDNKPKDHLPAVDKEDVVALAYRQKIDSNSGLDETDKETASRQEFLLFWILQIVWCLFALALIAFILLLP
jgi:hypothetical protein